MPIVPPIALNIRSYAADTGVDRHDFSQLVLPLSGALTIDIGGREDRIDTARAAYVDTGMPHSQMSKQHNRSLILDFDRSLLPDVLGERLDRSPFLALNPAAGKLVDYMGMLANDRLATAPTLQLWTPLLFDALANEAPRPQSRLAPLLAAIEADPGHGWTTETMARRAAVSVSRLHALFRSELDTTPRAWLAEIRLRWVRHWLAQSDRSIAELAYRGGYADQSALTRAMRRATGMTPAAWRRRARETRPKTE